MGFLASLADYNRKGDINYFTFILKNVYFKIKKKKIVAHNRTIIRGLKNIEINGELYVGTEFIGFLNKYDRTYLHIRGKLIINGKVRIEKGCRFDIGTNGVCILNNCSINGHTKIIVEHNLEIGENSIIGWNCEILDEDYHKLLISGVERKMDNKGILIGKHVWVGGYSKIYKGVRIGSDSVVAANSMVVRSFPNNVLIGGDIPAKIVMKNISWE